MPIRQYDGSYGNAVVWFYVWTGKVIVERFLASHAIVVESQRMQILYPA